jgi:hypothetical protein
MNILKNKHYTALGRTDILEHLGQYISLDLDMSHPATIEELLEDEIGGMVAEFGEGIRKVTICADGDDICENCGGRLVVYHSKHESATYEHPSETTQWLFCGECGNKDWRVDL